MSKKRTTIIVGGRTADLIVDALDYMAEDLDYRLGQGRDFEPEDVPRVERKIERAYALIKRMNGESE